MDNYLIKKGNHYANVSLFQRLFSVGWNIHQMSVNFKFAKECWWAPPRNSDDNDLNKLCGIGYGLSLHQNSVRFAWVPDFTKPGIINIYGYTYDENTSGHSSKFIAPVTVDEVHTGLIKSINNQYMLMVGITTIYMDNVHSDSGLSYRLFPYFGGNNTAPCDMVVGLEII